MCLYPEVQIYLNSLKILLIHYYGSRSMLSEETRKAPGILQKCCNILDIYFVYFAFRDFSYSRAHSFSKQIVEPEHELLTSTFSEEESRAALVTMKSH